MPAKQKSKRTESDFISFRVSEELGQWFTATAGTMGVTVSECARRLLAMAATGFVMQQHAILAAHVSVDPRAGDRWLLVCMELRQLLNTQNAELDTPMTPLEEVGVMANLLNAKLRGEAPALLFVKPKPSQRPPQRVREMAPLPD